MRRTLAIRLSVEHKRCKTVFRVETVVNDQFSGLAVACNNNREALVGNDANDVRGSKREFKQGK